MKIGLTFLGLSLASLFTVNAQFSINPLSSFGGGDGWFAPAEGGYAFLGTGNTERGMAYGNGHLYLVTRSGGASVRVLDSLTGAELSTLNFGTGIIGVGTFPVNMAGVGGDGAIYVANLASPVSAAAPFNVYRWANESATPTLAFSTTDLTLGRLGDTLAVTGSGASTRIAAGESNSSGSGNRNGYAILTSTDGVSYSGRLVTFTNTSAGSFRLGLTFRNANSVIGTDGSGTGATNTMFRVSEFSGTTGTLLGSPEVSYNAQRPMAYATVAGVPLLAMESTVDATVRIYDMTAPDAPVLLGTANNTSGTLSANANGTGQLAWGEISGNSAKLWALSSNQGIQAFQVTVPEPGVLTLLGFGCALFLLRRRGR